MDMKKIRNGDIEYARTLLAGENIRRSLLARDNNGASIAHAAVRSGCNPPIFSWSQQ